MTIRLQGIDAPELHFAALLKSNGKTFKYDGKRFPAQYSAVCGGRTRSLEGEGELIADYPYYSVPCEYCRRHSPGLVQGHRLGLCQSGAIGMALSGATFRAILDHYYPGAKLQTTN